MTHADLDLIARRNSEARALLNNDPDQDVERGEEALTAVITEHVDELLCYIEESQSAADEAYVRGLRNAAYWLATFDQDLPGFDRTTCRNLARGLTAMAESAAARLGLDAAAAPVDAETVSADTAVRVQEQHAGGMWWDTSGVNP